MIKIMPLCTFIIVSISCYKTFGQSARMLQKQAKLDSIQIVKIDTTKMKNTIMNKDSLKLLGFLGNKFIVSSLDNKKNFVLNQSAFDVIELESKGVEK